MTDFFLASFYGDKVMTDKELLQQALDALEKHIYEYETIQAIKARLTQPESAPTWIEITTKQGIKFIIDPTKEADRLQAAKKDGLCITPLYTAPPQPTKLITVGNVLEQAGYVKKKKWVGLTDEERNEIALELPIDAVTITEAKLKEKNS